ncbi:MAG: PAS domain-containing sensor histidine kinase, partial [Chloroflexota bacterium]
MEKSSNRLYSLKTHLHRFIDPLNSTLPTRQYRQAQFLAAVSLTSALLTVLVHMPFSLSKLTQDQPTHVIISVSLLAALTFIYWRSRIGSADTAAALLIGVMIAVIVLDAIASQDPDAAYVLYYLILPLLISGAFFELRGFAATTGAVLILVSVLPLLVDHLELSDMPLIFLAATSLVFTLLILHSRSIVQTGAWELSESEARYRNLFATIADALLIHHQGQFIDCNPAFHKLLGYDRSALESMDLIDLVMPDYREQVIERIRTGDTAPYEIEMRHQNGRIINVEAYARTLIFNGLPMRVTTLRDISDRRIAAQRTVALQVERERSQMLTRFINDASHDLRTPLTVIFSSLHLLRVNRDPERQAHYIETLNTQATHLLSIVENLLQTARLRQDGSAPFRFERSDLKSTLREIAQIMKPFAESRSITLRLDLPGESVKIIQDKTELTRAMRQLLTNAISYTPEGGTVTVSLRQQQSNVLIQVIDT